MYTLVFLYEHQCIQLVFKTINSYNYKLHSYYNRLLIFFSLQNIANYVNKQYLYKVVMLSLKTRGWTGELLRNLSSWKCFSVRNKRLQPGQWRRSRETMFFLITEGDIWRNMHSHMKYWEYLPCALLLYIIKCIWCMSQCVMLLI